MKAQQRNEPDEVVEPGEAPATSATEAGSTADGAESETGIHNDHAADGGGDNGEDGDGDTDDQTDAAATEPPDPLEELRVERDELNDRWLRAVAEMENLRRRTRREVADARRFALADLLRRFLTVQDDFDRALQNMPPAEDEAIPEPVRQLTDLRKGIELISQRMQTVLADTGVTRIEALGQPFDPTFHEAVGHREAEGAESGSVVEILQDGYTLGDLVLRPSRVVIAP